MQSQRAQCARFFVVVVALQKALAFILHALGLFQFSLHMFEYCLQLIWNQHMHLFINNIAFVCCLALENASNNRPREFFFFFFFRFRRFNCFAHLLSKSKFVWFFNNLFLHIQLKLRKKHWGSCYKQFGISFRWTNMLNKIYRLFSLQYTVKRRTIDRERERARAKHTTFQNVMLMNKPVKIRSRQVFVTFFLLSSCLVHNIAWNKTCNAESSSRIPDSFAWQIFFLFFF